MQRCHNRGRGFSPENTSPLLFLKNTEEEHGKRYREQVGEWGGGEARCRTLLYMRSDPGFPIPELRCTERNKHTSTTTRREGTQEQIPKTGVFRILAVFERRVDEEIPSTVFQGHRVILCPTVGHKRKLPSIKTSLPFVILVFTTALCLISHRGVRRGW